MPRINLSECSILRLAFFAPLLIPDNQGNSWENTSDELRLLTADDMFKLLESIIVDVLADDPETLTSRIEATVNPIVEQTIELEAEGIPTREAAHAALNMNLPIRQGR